MNFTDNLMTFSIELAQDLLNSEETFPISFSTSWQWLGYTRKDNAKRALLNSGFIENEDFLITEEATTTGISANLNENIYLTVECLKMWAMMSGTQQGKQVRLYFLECEKLAKQKTFNATPQTYIEALKALVAVEEAKEQLKLQNSILESQVSDLEEDNERQSEIIDEVYNYSSIIRVAKFNKVNEKMYSWRKLKATSEVLKLDILQAPCQRYGTKNIYSHEAWRIAYPEAKLPEILSLVEMK